MRPWILALCVCASFAVSGCRDEPPPVVAAPPPKPPSAPEPEPRAQPIVVRGGFEQPESAIHDPKADVYLVSNIDGKALEADGKGFISRVSPAGEVTQLKWIGGKGGARLNAPKGMALSGGKLYVADIDTLRVFDAETGAPDATIKIKGASFLNDVAAAPDGTIYVSDTGLEQWGPYVEPKGNDAIYRIDGMRAVPLIKDKLLGNPNGILADADGVWAVNKAGEVYRVTGDGNRATPDQTPKGTLDGIVKTPKGLLVSSWEGKAVYLRKQDGGFDKLFEKLNSPADIGFDAKRNRLLVPLLTEGALHIQPL